MKEGGSNDNFDIKLKDHFKLNLLLKDQIIFEFELNKNNIRYYSNPDNQPFGEGIRYFLLDSDMIKVDEILIKNEIVANNESNLVSDFSDQKKIKKLYIGVIVAFVIVLVLTVLLVSFFE